MLDRRGGVLRHFLVAQLVLLRQQLALLVLQQGDLIGGLRELCREREIEKTPDQGGAKAQVRVAEHVQVEALNGCAARHLDEATRAPATPGGQVLHAGGAQSAPRQYSS